MKPWCPGEQLTYYPEDKEICDDRGAVVMSVTSDRAGLFVVAAAMFAQWVDNHPDDYYILCAFARGKQFDEFFRHISRLRGLIHVDR